MKKGMFKLLALVLVLMMLVPAALGETTAAVADIAKYGNLYLDDMDLS